MAYKYTEQSRDEYIRDGLTVLRDLIPPALIADLRRESDKAREIAREQNGEQAQRLQPVYNYWELDHQPFRDFQNLPGLRDAIVNILGPDHLGGDNMGVLFEPKSQPWSTQWHRDWGYNIEPMDIPEFFRRAKNMKLFNQINAALYTDGSLWVVPGSHNREDTSEEFAAMGKVPPDGPDLGDTTGPAREVLCNEYARRMPGATQVTLLAGDCAFYRSTTWHIGAYVPYTKRATLHDGFYCDGDLEWHKYVKDYQDKVLNPIPPPASRTPP